MFFFKIINDEEWPPLTSEADVPMRYPKNIEKTNRFALGHSFFGLLPGLFMYSTIWLREHNRVCDILKKEHPEWDDERLFQTAKLVIVGKKSLLYYSASLWMSYLDNFISVLLIVAIFFMEFVWLTNWNSIFVKHHSFLSIWGLIILSL